MTGFDSPVGERLQERYELPGVEVVAMAVSILLFHFPWKEAAYCIAVSR